MKVILLTALLIGCSPSKGVLSSKEIPGIECTRGLAHRCGVHLSKCNDGNEYYCVKNVKEVKIK